MTYTYEYYINTHIYSVSLLYKQTGKTRSTVNRGDDVALTNKNSNTFTPLLVTLNLAGGHKVSTKPDLLTSFSSIFFSSVGLNLIC